MGSCTSTLSPLTLSALIVIIRIGVPDFAAMASSACITACPSVRKSPPLEEPLDDPAEQAEKTMAASALACGGLVAPNGTITGPTPVKLSSLDGGPVTAASVDFEAFNPKSVGFARLSTTVKEAIAKSHYADAHVNQWEISGLGPDDRRYLYLESSRARPVAILRPNLTIADMRY